MNKKVKLLRKRVFSLLFILSFLLQLLPPAPASAHDLYKVLVFSKTEAFRHDSIPAGIAAIRQLGAEYHFSVDTSEDSAIFNQQSLSQYSAVIFLNTTGDILNNNQQQAFENYIRNGNGYVGVHSASDTEYSWPWYGELVGAYFKGHPQVQSANVKVADSVHPSTKTLPKVWTRTDEWYSYQTNPRGKVHVLATLDEKSYTGGDMGFDHPFAWCHKYDGGRAWYTGGGHEIANFADTNFLNHLLGGIQWAAGQEEGDCSVTDYEKAFEKEVLQTGLSQPMSVKVAPDGRVFFIERGGALKIFNPQSGYTTVAGTLPVFFEHEDGLLGLELDPNFAVNQHIYLFYSPPGTPVNRLSRFTMNANSLTASSEKIMLEIPIDRNECCHSGGDLEFDKNGNLYISVGDNTDPFESSGFGPFDERPGRNIWDAQRTSGNTNDLRGKILRIKPNADGTYSIPAGNLFPSGSIQGRPEVYTMGSRNPFKIAIDPKTSWLYWGDVGPDAGVDNPSRGPKGYDEFNQARAAGNFGWPYCIANNQAYNDYNYATGVSGNKFNCGALVNDSPNNTGSVNLPPAQAAMIYYGYDASNEFPELEIGAGGRTATAGAVYEFDPASTSLTKFPAYFDNTLFIMEWSRNWIKEVKFDENGNLLKINPFMPGTFFNRPIDMSFGADGNMYLLEYGTGWGDNNDAMLVRIKYTGGGNKSPITRISANRTNGLAPLLVQFSSAGSTDPDNDAITFEWDLNGDGIVDSTAANPSYTYTTNGVYIAKLTVKDSHGASSSDNITITVGNTAPVVTLQTPYNGGFFAWGDTIPYQISVTDAEDSVIDCNKVNLLPSLGHDSHAHADVNHVGCEGTFTTVMSDTNIENTFYIVEASYADNGNAGIPSLTGKAALKLHSKDKQAEHYDDMNGIQTENTSDTGGGKNVGYIDNGDWIMWRGMNLYNIGQVKYRVSSNGAGGTIEMRADSPTGTLIASSAVANTGSWQTWTTITSSLSNIPSGQHDIYFVFKGGAGYLFNLNWIEFVGDGVAGNGNSGGAPTGQIVTLKSNNQFVTVTNSNGGTLTSSAGPAGANQQFRVVDAGSGFVALQSVFNQKYVAAEDAGASPLIANRDTIGSWEQFKWITHTDGTVSLQANTNGKYVAAGTNANVWIANRQTLAEAVKFQAQTVATGLVDGGQYRITAKHSGKVLDVAGFSIADGGTVHQWTWNNTSNQKWKVDALGGGYYKLTSVNSGKSLDVAGVGTGNGVNIQQWGYSGGQNQQWLIEDIGGGYYKIAARHSGKAVTVNGSSTADGAGIYQWDWLDTDNQKWKFELQ
ncbi:ThuA domain-containing protein [Paenibacillus sp. GCM10012307]|uniref:ThuA domain-containing protein n=1 Tax=Paenibacillus roseus TaxID=2798579 RepID=A0A934J3S3_9BACL|nr:ThuA domain-containing protein [Paenibacillus roseus]MBJ6359767.1 ThuA domain-containing protein [Paenibacillus roseus]